MGAVRVGSLCYTGWLSLLLEFMQQWLPAFAEVESPISVDVIWMHLNFNGFSDETIHVAVFCIHPPCPVTPLPIGPATTISGINTPHVPSLVFLHLPALEDGTDRWFRNVGF